MKLFNRETINRDLTILLIGIVVGGIAIGILDANRPQPIFSSAWIGDGDYEACLESSGHNQMQREIDDFIAAQQGPMSAATLELLDRWLNQLNALNASCNEISPEQSPVN